MCRKILCRIKVKKKVSRKSMDNKENMSYEKFAFYLVIKFLLENNRNIFIVTQLVK